MKNNSLWRNGDQFLRVLESDGEALLVIDCVKQSVPHWTLSGQLEQYTECTESELQEHTNTVLPTVESLDADARRIMQNRYNVISDVLPYISDKGTRTAAVSQAAASWGLSKQTVRAYLYKYLAYQNISALAPCKRSEQAELSADQRNMRWALNKYFYNGNKNSLRTAYTLMLKAKYCDGEGALLSEHPTFYQFRYYYRKTRSMQNYIISRDGLKKYQRNSRPLLGDGIQEFAPNVGTGMLDSTVCDIYLVSQTGELIGRPILTACIDAYSGLCMGYFLSWEGGVYSLRGLLLNVIADKVEHCKSHGIRIEREMWDCVGCIPSVFVTDRGSEYISQTLEQITETGARIVNLPSFRAELKAPVEKFFDLVQESYKPYLKGKGVIMKDFGERGAHDYRKDACLTLEQFEQVILRCIIYYNTQRIVESHPYNLDMLTSKVKPHASDIWNHGKKQAGANLIPIDRERLVLTLLPRTSGKFTRQGLVVNRMRYKHANYTEQYLTGGNATVAYSPEDSTYVWLLDGGAYVRFTLIEGRYKGMSISETADIMERQNVIVKSAMDENEQARIDLARHIEAIASGAQGGNGDITGIREARKRERNENHRDFTKR